MSEYDGVVCGAGARCVAQADRTVACRALGRDGGLCRTGDAPACDEGHRCVGGVCVAASSKSIGVCAEHLACPAGTRCDLGCAPVASPGQEGGRCRRGASDLLGLVSEPEPGLGVVAAAVLPDSCALDARTRAALARIALHLEAAVRLRHRPDAVVGYVTPSGRVELSSAAARTVDPGALSASTRRVDRARTRRHRDDGEGALAVWPALVGGRLSLAERFDADGRRLYDLYENAPRHASLRALTARESAAVHEAARGLSNKEIAYALGLSQSAVSSALSGAAQKLGLPHTRVLVRLASRLRGAGGDVTALAALSAAERAVVDLAARGWSNAQIAHAREVSERTVANQVAAALRKTGAGSRRGLTMIAP